MGIAKKKTHPLIHPLLDQYSASPAAAIVTAAKAIEPLNLILLSKLGIDDRHPFEAERAAADVDHCCEDSRREGLPVSHSNRYTNIMVNKDMHKFVQCASYGPNAEHLRNALHHSPS